MDITKLPFTEDVPIYTLNNTCEICFSILFPQTMNLITLISDNVVGKSGLIYFFLLLVIFLIYV